jgi:arylsulfatase A-like enzyme
MKALGIFDDTLIIVHGDHGSRIAINSPSFENRESLSDTDLRDNYSTLMAIHSGELEARYSGERRSIQSLFSEIIMGISASDETGDVYLRRGRGVDEAERHAVPMAWGD